MAALNGSGTVSDAPRCHACTFCNKTFKSRQAKYKHTKQNCIVARTKAFVDAEVSRKVVLIKKEMEDKYQHASVAVTINSTTSTSTSTSTNNNNNIVINNFRGVDVSHLAHDLVAEMIKRGDLRTALQEMVQMVHFDPEHPENMNAYLGDPNHAHGLCFRGGRWQPKPRDELAKMVMFNAAQVMNEHNDAPHGNDFTKKQTDRFDRFYDIIGYDRHPLVETIDTMAKNRHVVENAHPTVCSALTAAASAVSAAAGGIHKDTAAEGVDLAS